MTEKDHSENNKNRRGSVSVLLMCLLASLITVFFLMYGNASFRTLKNAVTWNGENAGQAVLSYYLPELKDRYDLYALWKEPMILEWRMKEFVENSSPFWERDSGSSLLRADCEQLIVDPEAYLFMDPELVKSQIDDVMEQGMIVDLIKNTELVTMLKEVLGLAGEGIELQEITEMTEVQRSGERHTEEEEDAEDTGDSVELERKWSELNREAGRRTQQGEDIMENIDVENGRRLEDAQRIIALPSRQSETSMEGSWDILRNDFSRLGEVIQSSLYTDLYALHYFGNYVERQDGWFLYQLEYVLQGELSDEENMEQTKRDLFFLRTILNMASLYRDEVLRQTIGTMAIAAAPIPYSVAFGVLAAAFSAAEAGEDVKVLMEGDSIPVLKSAEQWTAFHEGDIDSGEGGIPVDLKGGETEAMELSYENHLHILLLLRSQETKIRRMMDLVQLDLQESQGDSFTLKDVCGGFQWKMTTTLENSMGRERMWTCEGISKYGE